jgi:Fic family protein
MPILDKISLLTLLISKGLLAKYMKRITGTYQISTVAGEKAKAFIPYSLPPENPPFNFDEKLKALHLEALSTLEKLQVAANLIPNIEWFIYGFVRKEAVISSQIEGTQATLEDVLTFEATNESKVPADVEEICNYTNALEYARNELSKPKGLPICSRLLCNIHEHLMKGARGSNKQPGTIRITQNWIGGSRPGNAVFVPPPPEHLGKLLTDLEHWIHSNDNLPPLIRAGLVHVQFETIHPFLDGNGRIGRLFITLLLEHWKILSSPILYLSLSFKKHQQQYYQHLNQVRTKGDWEGWMAFFLLCVKQAGENAIDTAYRLFAIQNQSRNAVANHKSATMYAIRLFDCLANHPIITMPMAMKLLNTTKPTASKAIDGLCKAGILKEITNKKRDRVYAYHNYLSVLSEDTQIIV